MNLLKLFVESYVQFIGHIAWPLAIVAILFIFRKPIVEKLRGLTEARRGDTSFKFAVADLQEKISKKKLKFSEITKETLNWDNYLDTLEQWALSIGIYTMEILNRFSIKTATKDQLEMFISTMRQWDMVLEKIRENRPDSEILKILETLRDNSKAIFKRYEPFRPKYHWDDNL